MKIRTLIVDDMLLARKRVRRYLSADPDIEIIGECTDGREAIDAIKQQSPDLVFLDVQMPEIGGFEVLAALDEDELPAVIFITAYDQFALKAFEVHALDYLLKPFDAERLRKAVDRARTQLKQRQPGGEQGLDQRINALLKDIKGEQKHIKRLAVKSSGRTIFLLTEEIDWIETAGNYLKLQAGKESFMIRERMSVLETKLDPDKFVRIHRSTLVNIDRIKELQPLFNGDQLVILRDGRQLTMSRTYRDKLLSLLDEL
jgi:two-component system, LytTR family, response regulator